MSEKETRPTNYCLKCGKELEKDSTMTMHLKCAQSMLKGFIKLGC